MEEGRDVRAGRPTRPLGAQVDKEGCGKAFGAGQLTAPSKSENGQHLV